jgi:hypothetical protein
MMKKRVLKNRKRPAWRPGKSSFSGEKSPLRKIRAKVKKSGITRERLAEILEETSGDMEADV